MSEFYNYDMRFPELVVEILEHFMNNVNVTIGEFVAKDKRKNPDGSCAVAHYVVVRICNKLYDNNILHLNCRGGVMDLHTSYSFKCINKVNWENNRQMKIHYYNSIVYGFDYIRRYYTDKVLPIIAYQEDGTPSMGTAFRFFKGLITARHCVQDGSKISIQGYSAEQLKSFPVYISSNPYIDVAYIRTGEHTDVYMEEPNVLDDVLVMGYPNIPRFFNFCTAEKATISSKAELRLTPTTGCIAAIAKEMGTYKDTQLMLVTAKIKGGNSGGPVINKYGSIVGVAFSAPISEGCGYDDLGYGVATPIQILQNIIQDNNILKINFVDFQE